MKAIDMTIDSTPDAIDSKEHAALVFADARRRQLELALAGRAEESAVFAQVAATARGLIDEFEGIDAPPADDLDLVARRENLAQRS